ncbi:preprotein translocase subunit SecG [Sphingomonas ginkgonis]|uniref:Protein-export membrane protein SecG n=1 Tax=Sphingomonas ginkgonis TaxID=2315330 RepID=A0A429V9N8_9SPHN|nr:preprotein translocase subunit SecG [Sphingomonas ginkgonis]RST30703.1 preprotein translocase subunit SecG [Sphingomonas ginkgonis]
MFKFLLIFQILVGVGLCSVILMQRSEGGGLGVGGSSSGFMTARGAADFLTRMTAILGGVFIVVSILMAALAGINREPTKIDTSLVGKSSPMAPTTSGTPPTVPGPAQTPPQSTGNGSVPLAQ